MLDANLKAQLSAYLEKLTQPIELVASLDDSDKSRELDALPAQIEALEKEQQTIAAALADGRLFSEDAAKASQMTARNLQIEEALMTALERWESLGKL